ncbi:PREDICTED: basic blue protein-like [Prunus mume]|uniref:Basic blue protein-like n=1 Tax=Prunus mume TaxID=102107 RepID=A0ABM0N3H1_PRUMU|nr:PREDICTED: basic blue protein-like [Prunus mume]
MRGSAIVATMLLLCIMLPCCEISYATNYTVGDDDGWNFKVHDWPTGKKLFHSHDTLVFKYNNGQHNVAVVDENGYTTCTISDQVFSSGNDEIKLQHGQNYFICGFPGHCAAGMKMAVTAT